MSNTEKFVQLIHKAEQYARSKTKIEIPLWESIIDQTVEEYLGINHKIIHSVMLDYLPRLSCKTILSLWDEVHAPLTFSTLEFHIQALSHIMKYTHWNGSFNALDTDPSISGINDLYLSGHIEEYYTYYAEGTPLSVLFGAKKYFHHNDISLVHAALTAVQGLMGNLLTNENASCFIEEMIKCRDCSSDLTIKKQVDEILLDIDKRKEYHHNGGASGLIKRMLIEDK